MMTAIRSAFSNRQQVRPGTRIGSAGVWLGWQLRLGRAASGIAAMSTIPSGVVGVIAGAAAGPLPCLR
ncbi:hypothetical protein [Azospirillum sp. B506]|uniref:hypothetical protein n=1 Tax=Azospirillum sp. B506 TaxID=137721 RepID=UPI001FCBB89F|nr:hypothetical protein [Azospirillum sp. B506]